MNIINYLIMTNTLKENSDLTYSLFYKNKDYNNIILFNDMLFEV